MARQPLPDGRMLVGGVIVEDGIDMFFRLNLALDGIQEADEFLMAMALHVVADDRSVEDVHGREQSGRPVPLVVMGHSSGAAPLHRQAGLSTIEGLDLALFVDAEHQILLFDQTHKQISGCVA